MALPVMATEPSKLINSLDFEGKGLSHPVFVSFSRGDGKEARLVVKALFRGPRQGWPLLDRNKIFEAATRKAEKEGVAGASVLGDDTERLGPPKHDVPICLEDLDVKYPIKVEIRIALASQPGAVEDMLKDARAYSQLYANGYIPFELPIAMWRTVEGIWNVVMDEGGVSLPLWWECNVQPQIQSSESRWKIGSWRLKGPDHDEETVPQTVEDLKEKRHQEQHDEEKRLRFLDDASQQLQGLMEKKEELDHETHGDAVAVGVRAEQDKVVSILSKKTAQMKAEATPMTTDSEDDQDVTTSRKQEWAARIQQHKADLKGPTAASPEVLPITQQIGIDEDEAESRVIDKGWLQAVNVLIQIADTILSLHERRLCMVVCRPEFFNVCESRPFVSRSILPTESQLFSVQSTHLGTVVQMSGYNGGKLVGHMNGDFDGDKVTAMGPGSASAFTNFGTTASPSDDEEWMVGEDEGVGALRGVLDEASILRHLQYIAPEAISSTRAIASTVDIFSWGMTAYELLKGKGQEGTESDDDESEFYRAIHLHSTRAMPIMTSLCPSMPPELSAIVKKALALDPEERYSNFCSLLHDLNQVQKICDGSLRGQQRREFVVGHVDYLSRFAIPPGLMDREEEYNMLDEAYNVVKTTGRSQVVCCWGVSGSGKSKLLELWARQKEASNAGQDCFVSWAKMDQHLVKPLSAFISIFCSLLERVFSDPLESAADWRQRILSSLAVNASVFLALLPKEWRAILLDGQPTQEMDIDTTAGIDWESWVKQFRTWSYGLLRLFASENRPLLVIIDDIQWLEKSERELWEELITSETRRLDHCLILFSYRTENQTAPNISPLVPQYMIEARPFDQGTVRELVNQCFHLDDVGHLPEQWNSLCSYLYKNTKGNPFDLKWNLSALVRDSDITFSYQSQEWTVRKTVLNAHPDSSAEDFAASVLNSLSPQAKLVLCHLACLPSRGVEIALLAHLVSKSENAVKALLDECASLGSVIMRGTKVQFVHDKPHTAALALIDPQEKPRLFVKIARDLEESSTDYSFLRADLFIQAQKADPALIDCMEIVIASVRAARQAAASAALDLAYSYLSEASKFWSYSTPEAWSNHPELAMDLLTITIEVALGRRTATSVIENVLLARDNARKLSVKLDISAWLVKLQLSASCPNLALEAFFSALRLLGYDTPNETTAYTPMPVDEDDIRAIYASPPPPDTEQARVAISLASLTAIAMPTVYSFEVDKAFRIMQFVTSIYLHHGAAKAVSTAYSWYVMAILYANDLGTLDRARAYIDLGDAFDVRGNPLEGIVETIRATLAYIKTSSLKTIDYSRAKAIASQTKNHDVLSYTLGLDLSAQALSGHSIPELYNAGRDTLTTLADDLQPAIRLMAVPFIEASSDRHSQTLRGEYELIVLLDRIQQFGAHLIDSKLIQGDARLEALNVLEGEYVTPKDAKDISQRPPFYVAVYAIASLYLGLLFRASDAALRERAKLLRDNQQGGTGTIVQNFCLILLSITNLVLDDATDVSCLENTYQRLNALPHNNDFRAIVLMLKALEAIKECRTHELPWPEVAEAVEEALEALEHAQSYLFAGLLCLLAQDALKSKRFTARIQRGYLHHAQAAFKACGATNLVFSVESLLNALPSSGMLTVREDKSSHSDPSTNALSEGFLSHDVASTSSEEININGTDFPPKQKLRLESILRSFLILASERDSDGLIQRVLQVLLQVTCTSYACFATQDPATGSLKLKGYGSYENLKTCDISMAEAKEIAPTILLSHCSITKKPINASNVSTPANANLLRREPFFAKTGPPRTLLALPLFVQGRFSSLLFLSGKVSNAHPSTSQVGLLATFAAIILESNHAYATLESAVEMRTQQLQHALHSRSTFISGVSHEIRTPLFAIAGLCSVMEASADLTDAQRENLNVIRQSSDDLQRIVTAVLDWSKLDARSITPETIPFDLRNVIENALETVTHIARSKNIRLLLENPVTMDPHMPLLGDPHRYRQCLLNLLSNAIKFTKSTGADHSSTISVSWSWQERADKIEITCAVKDEGIGIPAKSMHRLFHSFSQVDSGISRNFGGTGLGLSITRGLARLLGGDCWAESVEGQGSTFYILITAAKTQAPDAEKPRTYPAGPARQAVLYAPRCLASSVILANLLAFGVTAHIADLANDSVPPKNLDYVLVDVDESLANAENIQRLRQRHPNSKFIFLVTLTEVSKYKDLTLDQDAIVTKPIKAQSLYSATKNLQTRDAGGSANIAQKKLVMDNTYSKRYPLKLAYIDDSSVNVAVGKKILSKFGYKNIDVCYDGIQAVEAAERTKYDLMLMDLQMPNMDGHTARRLIADNPKCGDPMVVALTANCDQPTKDRCLKEGFADFLSKPLIISDLAKLLIRAYEEKQAKAEAGQT